MWSKCYCPPTSLWNSSNTAHPCWAHSNTPACLHCCPALQKKRVASDLSAWEEEQRRKADEQLQQMELDAEIQAEVERQQVCRLGAAAPASVLKATALQLL